MVPRIGEWIAPPTSSSSSLENQAMEGCVQCYGAWKARENIHTSMHEPKGKITNLLAAWNGGSTFVVGAVDVATKATPARSHELLEAPERAANG